MAINKWGIETDAALAIDTSTGTQSSPVVADNGGVEFGVAWIDGNSIRVSFYDEQGLPNAALPPATVTDGVGTNLTDLQMVAGGSGMGYGIAWSELNSGVNQLKLRYYNGVAGSVLGNEISISTHAAVNQHDLSISAYGKDNAQGKPITDGFDAVWVEGAGTAHALGSVYLQRFAVPLDAKKDPSGPPVGTGLDGVVGGLADTEALITNSGRDPSVAGLHAHLGGLNETVVTWVDANGRINLRVYNDNGTQNNALANVNVGNLNTAAAPMSAVGQQHVIGIQGGGFVVAWVATLGTNNVLAARVFSQGAAAGTWTASAVITLDTLDGSSNGIADFNLASLETGGFTVSWSANDAGTSALFTRSFSAGGLAGELAASTFHAPTGDATNVATTGLIGDRYVAVYQNVTGADAGNISAQILDTRLDAGGNVITLNGPGITLIGDPDFETRGRIAPDVLVGTIGQDTIDGRQSDDLLDGGLGDDTIIAGQGNDSIDGGGGSDTLVLSGRFTNDGNSANDDYTIQSLGTGLFQITDKRANSDGVDIVRSVENFQFLGSGNTLTAAQLLGTGPKQITPTAWGWSNEDADATPDQDGRPDVDGFIVNSATRTGLQKHVSVADSVGEFVAVAWEQSATPGANTHIRGQFFDVTLAPDAFIPNTLNLSDGIGIETRPVITSGGANSGWGVVFEERDNAGDAARELHTNFVGPGQLTGIATMLSSAGNGIDGQGFGFGAPAAPFVIAPLPAGYNPATSDLRVTGLSGEDSNDLAIAWTANSPTSGGDLYAQHIKVILDPVTGIALSMQSEGDVVRVNADAAGNQTGGALAGLLGDRFIAVYEDQNPLTTDGSDLVARVFDTRDAVNPDPIVGDLVRPAGGVQARRDVLIGTNGDDNIRGDISDSNGLVDFIFSGMGNDTIQGGPGVRGAAGIPEIIDGGEGNDTAVYTGRRQDYSITVNGDGSIEVIDLRPVQNNAGNLLNHDGIDNLFNIENITFLDLSNGGASAETISFNLPGTPPPADPNFDGTPVAWSLDDTSQYKEIAVDSAATPGAPAGVRDGIAVTNLQDGAGLAWTVNGTQVWGISYDVTGKPDPILLGSNTQLTDGGAGGVFLDNAVGDIDIAMTGGLGMTAVWESTDGIGNDSGDTAIHLAFASTNTHVVLDPAGGVPGPGLPGGEIVVVGSDGAGISIDPVIQGYEIVDSNNDTLEVGFHVGFLTQDDGLLDAVTGDSYGALMLARYEIPVYDILLDPATGTPLLDANLQGQLATDAFGNFIPSTQATFGVGSETAPISIGLDGVRGTGDDGQAIVLTDQGLFAANSVPANANVLQGRSLSMGSLHDGQLVVSYIGADEQVRLKVYLPTVNQGADREAGGVGTDVVALGVTTYHEFTLPFATTLGAVAAGQDAITVAQQNGSFGVFWGASDGAGGISIQGIIYAGAGSNWSPSPVLTFATGLPASVQFQVAPTGVTPGGLEDGFFVSWESAGAGIQGQRFDMAGAAVGQQIVVGDPDTGAPGVHSVAGIDDGRMLVGYVDGNDVSAQYLDNRQAGVTLIGPRTGAPADVIAGTVGDDAIDGRALNDDLYGGLGDDLITMGSGADIGHGGAGNDTIIGASGQDQLLGEAGDDLLWGGLSGPVEAFNRDVTTGLTAAGVSAALIASNPGADLVSGGAGNDTISFQGEFGRFNINLGTGIVTSDRALTGNFILEDVIGALVDDGAGGQIFQFINDVENAVGGIGNDTLTGNAGDNVLAGGGGNNIFVGGGGSDTVIIDGVFATYSFVKNNGTLVISDAEDQQTITDVDFLQFMDKRVSFADVLAALAENTSATGDTLVTVGNINHAPVAADDTASVLQGHAVMIKVLANDSDADAGQVLSVTSINGDAMTPAGVTVGGGVVTLLSNGALQFTGNAGFAGPTSFSYTVADGSGGAATATVAIDVVSLSPNAGAAPLTIEGTAAEHQTLTAVIGVDPDGPGSAPTFQWFAGNVAIDGATGQTYAIRLADIGKSITVQATYTDAENFLETPLSAAIGPVAAINDFHAGLGISGTLAEHQQLTANFNGALDQDVGLQAQTPPSFQWLSNGVAITGATLSTYTLAAADAGKTISVTASYTDGQGFNEVVSAAGATLVTAVNDGQSAVTITGNAVVGQTLTRTIGADPDGAGSAPTTTWLRNGTAIPLATGATYVLTAADVGAVITARISYTDGQGFSETITSAGTTPVADVGLIITGTARGDTLVGGVGNDIINGLAGNDTITGNGGSDTVDAGGGNDTILASVNDGNDTYNGGAGTDTYSLINTTADATVNLAAGTASSAQTGVDVLVSIESVIGSAGNDTISGDAGDNRLEGRAGNDTLSAGSAGADVLLGGAGNDTYLIDRAGVTITEVAGEGTDEVRTLLAAFTLSNNVENLTYTGSGAFNGTGNGSDNVIVGGNGGATLAGGTGNDRLVGGTGNDSLNGGSGNDTLDAGTAGTDTLVGSTGNDTYIVDHLGVTVTENSNEGTDTVLTSLASYTLAGNVENLTFIGTGSFTGTGNGLANAMIGGSGADAFDGGGGVDLINGGLGNDRLTGGAGNDQFIFNSGFGHDIIVDFDANPAGGGQDAIVLSGMGITAANFAAHVAISSNGVDTVVTIDGTNDITLLGVTGVNANVVTAADFLFN